MVTKNFLRGLKLNRIRNIIIYASLFILILSLSIDLVGIDNSKVHRASITFFIYGLYLWALEHIFFFLSDQIKRKDHQKLGILWMLLALTGFIFAIDLALGVNILKVIWA